MSSFWAQKLGQQQVAAAPALPTPAPAQAPVNTGAWWMPKPTVAAPQQAVQPVQQQQQQPQTDADGKVHFGDLLRQENYDTTKAQSAKTDTTCPDCGSANFMGSGRAAKRCMACGYNELFTHSTHGASGIGQANLPTHTARVQVNTPPAGFAPMGAVVGHA